MRTQNNNECERKKTMNENAKRTMNENAKITMNENAQKMNATAEKRE